MLTWAVAWAAVKLNDGFVMVLCLFTMIPDIFIVVAIVEAFK